MYMTKQLGMNLEFTFSVLLHDIYFDIIIVCFTLPSKFDLFSKWQNI